ncbi:MAG: hypothetical protein ACREP8_02880, partial [Candidatus Binatia bacterium]
MADIFLRCDTTGMEGGRSHCETSDPRVKCAASADSIACRAGEANYLFETRGDVLTWLQKIEAAKKETGPGTSLALLGPGAGGAALQKLLAGTEGAAAAEAATSVGRGAIVAPALAGALGLTLSGDTPRDRWDYLPPIPPPDFNPEGASPYVSVDANGRFVSHAEFLSQQWVERFLVSAMALLPDTAPVASNDDKKGKPTGPRRTTWTNEPEDDDLGKFARDLAEWKKWVLVLAERARRGDGNSFNALADYAKTGNVEAFQ